MSILDLNCTAFACMMQGNMEGAEAKYREALSIDPDNADALRYLGELVGQSGRAFESVEILKHALAVKPTMAATWLDLGQAMQMLSQTEEEMVESLAHTLMGTRMAERQGGVLCAGGHYNQSLALLALGDWHRGWREYESGFLCHKRALRVPNRLLWTGERIEGKRLFVFWEGGLGDTVCWTRFLPLLKEQSGAEILFEVQTLLGGLYKQSMGAHDVCREVTVPNLDDLRDLSEFDCMVSIQSLPHLLGIDLNNIPNKPYLFPRVAPWPIRGPQYKVGIVWKGNPKLDNDANRSTTEDVLMGALSGTQFCKFYSLQYGVEPKYATPMPIKTYLDTAAMIKSMDLIITVDTSVAHLAGAMGKDVWVITPFISCDYRWGLQKETTPIYPSWRLYRQKTSGDYGSVMQRIRCDLDARVHEHLGKAKIKDAAKFLREDRREKVLA